MKRRSSAVETDRCVAAFDAGDMVGTSSVISLEVTLPGLTRVRAGGVANVGVLPTHTRQGLLTEMMRQQLDDMRERGEVLALLTASEGGIYSRFGFGPATSHAVYRVSREGGRQRVRPSPGEVSLIDPESAAKALPAIFDEARRAQPGDVGRPDAWWDDILADNERGADGIGALFSVVHSQPDGLLDGYALYRIDHPQPPGAGEPGVVKVRELCAVSPAAYSRLWAYLCDIDLTSMVEARSRPMDEPLRWMLADPRQLRQVSSRDHIWARLVDLPGALMSRRYGRAGSLVLEVQDRFCPWNSGSWRLDASTDGAEATPVPGATADVSLEADDLGCAYLGATTLSSLSRGGRVAELRPGALQLADQMFSSDPPPFCASSF